jgi:hypothetical protein
LAPSKSVKRKKSCPDRQLTTNDAERRSKSLFIYENKGSKTGQSHGSGLNVPNLKPSDFKETEEYTNNISICFTNNKQKEINDIKMKELNIKKHGRV